MKHFLMRCSIVIALMLTLALPVQAAQSYSHLYIAISDALMNTKQDKEAEAKQALEQFAVDWAKVSSEQKEAKAKVDEILAQATEATSKDERLEALSALSNALRALEKLENPVDEAAQRAEFGQKFKPIMADFEKALASGDIQAIDEAYKDFNSKWNKNERPVREQSIAMYGQIETQMAFLRISISAEEPDVALMQSQFADLKQTIEDFVAGKETAEVVEGEYSLATLIAYIDEANDFVDAGDYQAASNKIREFITIWPSVEIEISTRNGSLYTKIESDMPIIASDLLKSNVDQQAITKQLNIFRTEIELMQGDSDYTIWDAALILLREGLEALLIILALVSFLNKSGQNKMRKWIYIGAFIGVLLSAVAAILMSTILNSATIDTNRELMEGYVGLIAAAMMIGVGIWLHSKSSVVSWNRYISKQMGNAISSGSIFAMAMISFLSVFREGAETLVFYAGIAPKMETSQFILGIVVALLILAVLAVVLFKASGKIPIHKFFAVATILIYVLAFKIIGVSLHTLQLTDNLSTTIVDGLPVISLIGFYPTVETIIGQSILLVLVAATVLYKKKQA
ncbi:MULTISPECIES: FTR1 family iron permease [Lysinibacillus]|uniref:FTR1 family iron permease n=1 Tax=Lysinibacillus TaxID=400634 RepID=UPI0021A7950B|nr:FTR1 family protein [Lysinibacillus capsici]MCT1539003.1 FTR1 family protein [Lysinibacillus capsici]MCT1569780.1 FTR1 family protein [Lysinibacillus capsici]MCT1647238.1 FTR1 family protein [Lysinibacillus capsici]MCT1725779.1 FTR1 family protein [Lysinibacillus capsici]MCT1782814.1 FTR1 family protein [Lysinibacillus capsici]